MTAIPELDAYLAAHPGTRFLDAVMFDLCGTAIGKRYPVRDAAKVWTSGVAFCAGITTLDALGACWDVEGIGFSDGDPDATSYPVAGTLVPVPWAEATAQVLIAPAPPEGAAGWWFDPRTILQGVVARFAALGVVPVVVLLSKISSGVKDPDVTLCVLKNPMGRKGIFSRVFTWSGLHWSACK